MPELIIFSLLTGKYKTYFNLFIVFLVSGIWHGAAMTFVIWGAIHGIIIVLEKATGKFRKHVFQSIKLTKKNLVGRLFFMMVTFVIVCFAWIFFRANSLKDAFAIIKKVFSFDRGEETILTEIGMDTPNFYAALIFIALMIIFEIVHKRKNMALTLAKQNVVVRWGFYIIAALVMVTFGIYGSYNESQFIYFQF